jgi:carbonic anhydrase/acetyltransferase-like protein (isoleucine patch superfamily)
VIKAHQGISPNVAPSAWVAENAMVLGQVELGANASVWYGSVLRGDVGRIRIGENTNIQDLSVIHIESGTFDTTIGSNVTVGHRVMLHGCTVHDYALIGIGSILLNGAEVGAESLIGAGSLVTPGTKIPPGVLALGSPCRVKRPLTDAEKADLHDSARHYVQLARDHRDAR